MTSAHAAPTGKRAANRALKSVTAAALYHQLTYMSATASAGIARNLIFGMGARLARPTAPYFHRVHLLAARMGYDYARACSLIGDAVKSMEMKSLLLRLADALVSGQPEVDFLTEESEVQGQVYEKEYERDLTSLTKWTDAYGAIIISTALIIIINLVSTMIYSLGIGMILGLVILACFTALGGTWILARSAPDEVRDLFSSEGPQSQRWALRLARIIPIVTVMTTVAMIVMQVHLGWVMIVDALLLLPLGVASLLGGREIAAKDKEIGPFFRSLGTTTISTGTTLTEALSRLDLGSFPALQPDLRKLRLRLQASIDPTLCWRKFSLETGSQLIADAAQIFTDAVELGGDADTVGLLTSEFANRTIMLRAKRGVVTSTFASLTLVIHGAIAALMVIIMEVMQNFITMIWSTVLVEGQDSLQSVMLPLPSLDDPEVQLLHYVTQAMVLLLTLANATAMSATDGGHKLRLSFYLSILMLISGVCFLIVPPLVGTIMPVG